MAEIILAHDLEELVHSKIRSGTYRDVSEVIHAGLRLLREREEQTQALRLEVSAGLEQAEQVVDSLYAAWRAMLAGDQAAAERALSTPAFTLGGTGGGIA